MEDSSKNIDFVKTKDKIRYYSVHDLISSDNKKIFRKNYVDTTQQNKYQRIKETHNIVGFVVNIHDATNFDIDLEIPAILKNRYKDVVSNQYTYLDTTSLEPTIGVTYRCRLRGIGVNQLPQQTKTWKNSQMCIEVKRLVDRVDGWVTCTLSDIDIYHRLLVDITINTCEKAVNIKDYLLSLEDGESLFYPYLGNSTRKKTQT